MPKPKFLVSKSSPTIPSPTSNKGSSQPPVPDLDKDPVFVDGLARYLVEDRNIEQLTLTIIQVLEEDRIVAGDFSTTIVVSFPGKCPKPWCVVGNTIAISGWVLKELSPPAIIESSTSTDASHKKKTPPACHQDGHHKELLVDLNGKGHVVLLTEKNCMLQSVSSAWLCEQFGRVHMLLAIKSVDGPKDVSLKTAKNSTPTKVLSLICFDSVGMEIAVNVWSSFADVVNNVREDILHDISNEKFPFMRLHYGTIHLSNVYYRYKGNPIDIAISPQGGGHQFPVRMEICLHKDKRYKELSTWWNESSELVFIKPSPAELHPTADGGLLWTTDLDDIRTTSPPSSPNRKKDLRRERIRAPAKGGDTLMEVLSPSSPSERMVDRRQGTPRSAQKSEIITAHLVEENNLASPLFESTPPRANRDERISKELGRLTDVVEGLAKRIKLLESHTETLAQQTCLDLTNIAKYTRDTQAKFLMELVERDEALRSDQISADNGVVKILCDLKAELANIQKKLKEGTTGRDESKRSISSATESEKNKNQSKNVEKANDVTGALNQQLGDSSRSAAKRKLSMSPKPKKTNKRPRESDASETKDGGEAEATAAEQTGRYPRRNTRSSL